MFSSGAPVRVLGCTRAPRVLSRGQAFLGPLEPALAAVERAVEQLLSGLPPCALGRGDSEAQPRAEAQKAAVQPRPESAPASRGCPRAGPVSAASPRGRAARRWSRPAATGGAARPGRVYLARRKPGGRGRGGGRARRSEPPPSVAAARQRGRACGPGGPRARPGRRRRRPGTPRAWGPRGEEAAWTPRRPRPGSGERRTVGDPRRGREGPYAPSERGPGRGAPPGGGAGGGRWQPGGRPARGGRGCRRRARAAGLSPTGVQVWARPGPAAGVRVEFRVRGDRGQGGRPGRAGNARCWRAFGQAGVPTSLKCFLMTHLEPSGRLLPSPPLPSRPTSRKPVSF